MPESTWLLQLAALPLVYVYAVALEWTVHRYIFHGLGRRKGSRFRFHYVDHHRASRRNAGGDPVFETAPMGWNASGRERAGIALAALAHAPLLWVAPLVWAALVALGVRYHLIHRWCRERLPWHWDHHMGSAAEAEANWAVTCQWFDKLMGTRVQREDETRASLRSA